MIIRKYISKYLAFLALLMITLSCSVDKSGRSDDIINRKVDSVLDLMTLEEKLGQLTLYTSYWDITGPVMREDYIEEIKAGRCGNIFNAHTVSYNKMLQEIAVNETRLGIPLLFGYDVIHGHKTIFPVPIAEACSWNLDLMEKSARYSAMEAAASGITWTFAPMVDLSRDPRWGRITEGNGEDPYLGARIAEARVKGIQGEDLSDSTTIAACVKHFAAYGAPVAGRDYNTVDMSEMAFRETYLPPYKAAIEAGAMTVMASFNDLFGLPSHANPFLLETVLRDELDFKGFVVADYAAVDQLIQHGVAKDRKQAGVLALNAGLDMDMQAGIYAETLAESVADGSVKESDINEAVKRVLRVKFMLGLFEDPFRYLDPEKEENVIYSEKIMEHALDAARESIVLLKNDPINGKKILPLDAPGSIALIGPLADNQLDLMGSWHAAGDHNKVVTIRYGLQKKFPSAKINYARGCDFYEMDKSGFPEALTMAAKSDYIVLAIGENQARSGEAASRTSLDLPGLQEELALKLIKTGKPVVVMILAERMLTFPELNDKASAIIYGWHPGTRAGDAIADILSGDFNPAAKLVMSMPYNVGQVPVYYNEKTTGRPKNVDDKYTSKYLDAPNEPLYPFGYGLSYTSFKYGDPALSAEVMSPSETLILKVEVTNSGPYDGHEIIQMYLQDQVASVTRPKKELKDFKKIFLKKGEVAEVTFEITNEKLKFYNSDLDYNSEAGEFILMTGPNSKELKNVSFKLIAE